MAGRTLIKNGTVVTMNDAGDVHFGGSVVLEGDRIADVGPADEVAARQPAEGAQVIDAEGKAVLPGLVDLHYHTALGKGWSDHLPLWEYLETCWYPIIRALDDDAAYWAALASYSESIKCGVTTVNDMYRQLTALADAAGMVVVVDRCMKVEHARFCGGLSMGGLNSGIITSRWRPARPSAMREETS